MLNFSPILKEEELWVQEITPTANPGNYFLKIKIKESCWTMQEINQQLFVNCFGFSCAGAGISCLEKGRDSKHLSQLTKQLCYVEIQEFSAQKHL